MKQQKPNLVLHNPIFSLLLLCCFFTFCNGQKQQNIRAPKTIISGQPKLIKTQGSDQSCSVTCGLQDKAGNLWFGTWGEDVYRYDGKFFSQFTMTDGLNCNFVSSILEDKNGNIWLGIRDGLYRFFGILKVRPPQFLSKKAGNFKPKRKGLT